MRNLSLVLAILLLLVNVPSSVSAQITDPAEISPTPPLPEVAPKKEKPWYEKINLRGYAQLRYNRLLETNPLLQCDQCDRSWGGTGGFFFRRILLIFSGNVSDRVYIYIPPFKYVVFF